MRQIIKILPHIQNLGLVFRIIINLADGHSVFQRVNPAGGVVNGNLTDCRRLAGRSGFCFTISQQFLHQSPAPVINVNQRCFINDQIFIARFSGKFGQIPVLSGLRKIKHTLGNKLIAVKNADHMRIAVAERPHKIFHAPLQNKMFFVLIQVGDDFALQPHHQWQMFNIKFRNR